jgi:hypothetical protein
MKSLQKNIIITLVTIILITSCDCIEPNENYVKGQFYSRHRNDKLVRIENIENSPPCFYWKISFEDSLANIKSEIWQFWEVDTTDCNWRLKILNNVNKP